MTAWNARLFTYSGMTSDLAYLLGVFMGDGNVCHIKDGERRYAFFQVEVVDPDFLEKVADCVQSVLGYRPPVKLCRKAHDNIRAHYHVRVCSTQFALWLADVTVSKTAVPDDVLTSNHEIKRNFFQGLMDSEGSLTPRRMNESGRVIYSPRLQFAVKDEWIGQVHAIAAELGVKPGKIFHSGGAYRFLMHPDNYARAGLLFSIQRKQEILSSQVDHQRMTRPSTKPKKQKKWSHPLLTADQVMEIRRKHKDEGITYAQLGIEYGLHKVSIGRIVRGDTYGNDCKHYGVSCFPD